MNDFKKRILSSIKLFEKRVFPVSTELIYKGHVPFVAFFILGGEIELRNGKKTIDILKEGQFVGLENLIDNTPMDVSVVANSKAELYVIDRSTLNEV